MDARTRQLTLHAIRAAIAALQAEVEVVHETDPPAENPSSEDGEVDEDDEPLEPPHLPPIPHFPPEKAPSPQRADSIWTGLRFGFGQPGLNSIAPHKCRHGEHMDDGKCVTTR